MAGFLVSRNVNGTQRALQRAIRKYERPNQLKGVWQLANTFIPYSILCILMYLSYKAGFPYWITICLGIVASGLLVRIFIFFHDCTHQSFFASRKANTVLGYI
jgi:omega-6 fatty acid desaturase (delta-12 desaturase)